MELMNGVMLFDINIFMNSMQIGNHTLHNNTLFPLVRTFSDNLWFFS